MLGREIQPPNPASLISANPLKVNSVAAQLGQPAQNSSDEILRPFHQLGRSVPLSPTSDSAFRRRRRRQQRLLASNRGATQPRADRGYLRAGRLDIFPTASSAGIPLVHKSQTALGAGTSQPQPYSDPVFNEPAASVLSPQHLADHPHTQGPSNIGPRNPVARQTDHHSFIPQPPFRTRFSNAGLLPRPHSARLWNPSNSTPRPSPSTKRLSRRRRPSTPPPPSIPFEHPAIDITSPPADSIAAGAGDYPLLTLTEQRQNRHSGTARTSLQIEDRTSGDRRVSLPKSLRYSSEAKRNSTSPQVSIVEGGTEAKPSTGAEDEPSSWEQVEAAAPRQPETFGLFQPTTPGKSPSSKLDKGKGKAVMASTANQDVRRSYSKDLERGPDVLEPRHSQGNLSLPDLGSVISSSDSSIMGDPDQPDLDGEWGPQHPCYPHLNPHVPMNSGEYASTRIIRVRRDWLVQGDLAPTFSNLYPEILDPAGVSEQEFRRVIEKLNAELVPVFNPYHWRNIFDGVIGLVTGWVWDDFGLTGTKSRLRGLEAWIEKWNAEMEKTAGSDEGAIPPKIVPLRRTGYMTLDIQIADPEIAPAGSQSSHPNSRSGPVDIGQLNSAVE
ncbi:Golgin subfamily A member 7/ERF4 family-domain-containing protein [Xylariales sp. PMI_506]|nr:Golgin subfamily A member 7/ERF4 family-domain-containing protein [Xylariales sp. PMI_506]